MKDLYSVAIKYLNHSNEVKELDFEEWVTIAADAIQIAADATRERTDCKLVISAVAERQPGKRRA